MNKIYKTIYTCSFYNIIFTIFSLLVISCATPKKNPKKKLGNLSKNERKDLEESLCKINLEANQEFQEIMIKEHAFGQKIQNKTGDITTQDKKEFKKILKNSLNFFLKIEKKKADIYDKKNIEHSIDLKTQELYIKNKLKKVDSISTYEELQKFIIELPNKRTT